MSTRSRLIRAQRRDKIARRWAESKDASRARHSRGAGNDLKIGESRSRDAFLGSETSRD